MSLWFARFKAGYRFGQLAICCKIVRSLMSPQFAQDYVRVEKATPVARGDGGATLWQS
ncbi:hypothetical protein KCP70_00075 [Salmonella enterica subsp. enterica]|nr:hypothetical protein KCP70_00075 [Salmonella enterica subsp. enterica]